MSNWLPVFHGSHSRILLKSLVIFLLITVGGGLYARQMLLASCEVESVARASTALLTQMKEFDDVYISTTAGFQSSITFPVSVMQQIMVDTGRMPVPACLETAQSELIEYMRDVIRAFDAFEAGEADSVISGLLNDSYAHVRVFLQELREIEACAPLCIRL